MSGKMRVLRLVVLVFVAIMASRGYGVRGAQADDKLEVFSYWTSGGEAAALNALFDSYKKVNAKTEIINAVVAGGAGTNAQAALQARLQAKNPPDTRQSHPSAELQGFDIAPGSLEPVTDL